MSASLGDLPDPLTCPTVGAVWRSRLTHRTIRIITADPQSVRYVWLDGSTEELPGNIIDRAKVVNHSRREQFLNRFEPAGLIVRAVPV